MTILNLFKDFWKQFLHDWKEDWNNFPVVFWLEVVGVSCAIIGSALMAFYQALTPFWLMYTLFFISSTTLTIAAVMTRRGKLFILNFWFTVINTYGLIVAYSNLGA